MKLSVVAVVAATAGLAQVSAAPAPLRIMVVSSSGQDGAGLATIPISQVNALRYGHPVPPMPMSETFASPPFIPIIDNEQSQTRPNRHRRPCAGMMRKSRLRQKAIEISNAIRQAFGLPLIEMPPPRHFHHAHPNHSQEAPNGASVGMKHGSTPRITEAMVVNIIESQSHPRFRFHHHGNSFIGRLHYSLLNLGPWEGRAVAFVIGCGMGVLIRMFWVLFIVGYRAIRGRKSEEREYTEVIFIEEEDVLPPAYPEDKKLPVEEQEIKASQ